MAFVRYWVISALLHNAGQFQGQRVALVLCGENIERDEFAKIVRSS